MSYSNGASEEASPDEQSEGKDQVVVPELSAPLDIPGLSAPPVGSELSAPFSVAESPPALTLPRLGLRERARIFRREVVRLFIVLLLFLAFILTIVWAFISASSAYWTNVKDLLDLILPAETALLGTAIAFYMTDSHGGGED